MMTGSDEPANDHADVLFVGLDAEALTADVRRVVEQRRCVFLGDVYRALARVPRISPAVVVIGVDWLPEAAFEVFELLARRDRDLTVLVAGSERATAKIELARARGATGVLDAQALIDGFPPLRNDAGAADTSADNPETPVRSTAVMDPPASPATPGEKRPIHLPRPVMYSMLNWIAACAVSRRPPPKMTKWGIRGAGFRT
jgi:hypothetical protein